MALSSSTLGRAIVLIFLIVYTVSAGVVFCFNTLVLYIEEDLHVKLTLLEWLGALPASIPMLAAPGALWLNSKLGTWPTLAIGTLMASAGLGLSSVATNIELLFFAYGTLTALGFLLLITPPFFLIEQIYPYSHQYHVLATSIISCGFPLAALIMNPLANRLALDVGWHMAYCVLGAMVAVSGTSMVAAARLWSTTASREEPPANQETIPTVPPNTEGPQGDNYIRLPGEAVQNVIEDVGGGDVAEIPPASLTRKLVLFGMWTVASITTGTGYYTPMLTLLKMMDSVGVPRSQSWKVMPVVGACELISRLLASSLGDKLKGKTLRAYILASLLFTVVNGLGFIATNYLHFMAYGAGIGILGGPIIASLYSCSAEVLHGQEVPLLFSLFRLGSGVACMIGPVIVGAIHDTLGTVRPSFFLFAAFDLFAACLYSTIYVVNWIINRKTDGDKVNLLDHSGIRTSYNALREGQE